MLTAWLTLGVSPFILLIADISCYPLNKGFPQTSTQSGNNIGGNTNFVTNMGPPSNRYSSEIMPNNAPSNFYTTVSEGGTSFPVYRDQMPSYTAASAPMPVSSSFNTAMHSVHAPPVFVSAASMPAQQGFLPGQQGLAAGSSMPAQPGFVPAVPRPVQPGEQEVNWLLPPRKAFTVGEEMIQSVGSHSHGPGHAHADDGQFLPPPRPSYQSGELSHFEKNAESGNYQSETEEIGLPPAPHPIFQFPNDLFTSPFGPHLGLGGLWGSTYPYFDMMFMTGQYPPGTVTHFSHNFEQGKDFYRDTHYNKDLGVPRRFNQRFKDGPQPPGYVQMLQS